MTKRTTARWRSLAGAAAVLMIATLATACGDSGGGEGSDSGARVSTATGSPIVIGQVGSFSGAQASSLGGAAKVLQAWADSVNASGGIRNHPVKLITKDLGTNLTGGLAAVKDLVENQHVVAIVNDQDNGDASWQKYIEGTDVPVVGGSPFENTFMTSPSFFGSGTNGLLMAYGMLQLAKRNGDKLGFLYCAESPACTDGYHNAKRLAPVAGITIPTALKYSATQPNFTAQCQALKSAGVQSYFVGASSAVIQRVSAECKANGVTAKLLAVDGSVSQNFEGNSAVDGVQAVELNAPWFDSSSTATKERQEVVKKYVPDLGALDGPNAQYAWVAGKLFQKAVEGIPARSAITSDTVKQSLWSMKNETLDGLAPPLTFTQGKPVQVSCYFVIGVSNAKFVAPQGLKPECVEAKTLQAIAARTS